MAVLKITGENFESIKSESKPVLIDFYADWCAPCQMMSPVVEELSNERDDFITGKVNVDEESELAVMFGVESIPMFAVIKGGKVTAKHVGMCRKDTLIEMIDNV
ncbi:MAG: thioredoxin [Oscillospiraceae bacterium]|nr:thioredoxin [Oscillospiraceae bacterium]